MTKFTYSPVLKSKRGEAKGLVELDPFTKRDIMPFFDILALKPDAMNGSDVHEHVTKQSINIATAWKQQGPCYVDLFDVTPAARGIQDAHPATIVFDRLAASGVAAIPVVGIERDIAYKFAIRYAIAEGAEALAIRLDAEDIQLPSALAVRVGRLISEVGATNIPVHIFLDFRSIEKVASDIIQLQAAKALRELRWLDLARVVFSSSAMVSDMGAFKPNSVNTLPRRDFLTWTMLSAEHEDLDYADYGVVHPDYFDLDPRIIKPAAKIRYASTREWVIVKGTRWQTDTSQHHQLSRALEAKPQFRGGDSWGGKYIESAALGRAKYGSLETWVSIDQNNHVTHTARQLARISAAGRLTV